MGLVNVERTGGGLMARLAHPLFGELRRASAGEMYLSGIRGRLATRLAKDGDTDMQATVRRALLRLESDLDPDPELYLEVGAACDDAAGSGSGRPVRHGGHASGGAWSGRGAGNEPGAARDAASRPRRRCAAWLMPPCPTATTGRRCGRPT